MYRYVAFLIIASMLSFAGCKGGNQGQQPLQRKTLEEGQPAPIFTLKDLDGKTVNISDFKGSVVLINFWATWCPPCRSEMPSLQKLYAIMMDDPKFVMLGVLYKDEPVNAQKFAKETNIAFPILIDENFAASSLYGITGVPETYVIDKKGILRKKIIGPDEFDTPDAIAFFKGLLAEKP